MTDNEEKLRDFCTLLAAHVTNLSESHYGLYDLVADNLPNLAPEVRAELKSLCKHLTQQTNQLKEFSANLPHLIQ